MSAKYPMITEFTLLGATDITWSPWSAPESSGGIKAERFDVVIKNSSGTVIVPRFSTDSSMISLSDLTPTEAFKEKEKYTVGIIPIYNDGDGEYGEFEVVFDDLSELSSNPSQVTTPPVVNPVPVSNPVSEIPPGAPLPPTASSAPAPSAGTVAPVAAATAQAAATVTPPVVPVVAAPAATTAPVVTAPAVTAPAPANTAGTAAANPAPAAAAAPAPAATAAAVATPASAVTAPANTAGATAPAVVATAAVTAAPATANTAGTAAAANPAPAAAAATTTTATAVTRPWFARNGKRISLVIGLISVLLAIWPIIKWVRSHRGSVATTAIAPVATNAPAAVSTEANALYEKIDSLMKKIEALEKAQTNVQTQVRSSTRSELPSIKGIEGDNNDDNEIVMLNVNGSLHVTTGSYNGSDTTVRSAVKAAASAVRIPGNGLPPGCNRIREIDMSKMSFQPGKVTNLPAIEMVPGEYIRVILPPYPWNCKGVWYSSGKVLTSRNGLSCESGPVADNTDDDQQTNVSELGYWLERGTTNGRLELRVY